MTRVFDFFLIAILLVSCTVSGNDGMADNDNCIENKNVYFFSSVPCTVMEFLFSDVSENVKDEVMIGPIRVIGVDDMHTLSSFVAPYKSLFNNFMTFNVNDGGTTEDVVTIYSDKCGFFVEYSPCWRFYVVTSGQISVDELLLEINYSYFYESDTDSGFMKCMERLPLSEANLYSMDRMSCKYVFDDENLPFSIICICFSMQYSNFLLL